MGRVTVSAPAIIGRVTNSLRRVNGEYLSSVAGVPVESQDAQIEYPVTVNAEHGTLVGVPQTLKMNGRVGFTCDPDEGYIAPSSSSDFQVTNVTLSQSIATMFGTNYYLSNPTGPVTISVTFPEKEICLAWGTEVLLADGSTKQIQEIGYDDLLLTYDPYLGRLVSQYPLLIVEGPSGSLFRLNFKDAHLDISRGHDVYDLGVHRFRMIRDNGVKNITAAMLRDGSFLPSEFVSVEELPDDGKNCYSIFTPMHGAIITNGLLTGGDFLYDTAMENLTKSGLATMDWSAEFKDLFDRASSAVDFQTDFEDERARTFSDPEQRHLYLERYFRCSGRRILPALRRMGVLPESAQPYYDLDASLYETWNRRGKPYPSRVNIAIDDAAVTLDVGEDFVLPPTHDEYLDLSTYERRKAGETVKAFVSTRMVGLDETRLPDED